MRDRNRIQPILKLIQILWENNSDLRFSQIMIMIERIIKEYTGKDDIFYLEDDKVYSILLENLNESGLINELNPQDVSEVVPVWDENDKNDLEILAKMLMDRKNF